MSLLDIFRKKGQENELGANGMENFMTLIRVYCQGAIASNVGVTNPSMFPELRTFKQTFRVQTINNKLGVGEKNFCKKMLQNIYQLSDSFFKELDQSIKRNCRNVQEIQKFLFLFQNFTQDFLTAITTELQWKLRMPSIFKKTLYNMISQSVQKLLTQTMWKDMTLQVAASNLQKYQKTLGYSQDWLTEYIYHIVCLAKKEAKNNKGKVQD